jgi:hypothetical protein
MTATTHFYCLDCLRDFWSHEDFCPHCHSVNVEPEQTIDPDERRSDDASEYPEYGFVG